MRLLSEAFIIYRSGRTGGSACRLRRTGTRRSRPPTTPWKCWRAVIDAISLHFSHPGKQRFVAHALLCAASPLMATPDFERSAAITGARGKGRTGSFACRLNKRRPAEPPVPPYRLGEASTQWLLENACATFFLNPCEKCGLERPVHDETRLTGRYNLKIDWAPESDTNNSSSGRPFSPQ